MAQQLCDDVVKAWEEREGPVVLTTVGAQGVPNSIYAGVVNRMKDGRLAVVDNYFVKSKANLVAGPQASILFFSKSGKSCQVKGKAEYHADGPLHAEMLEWANPKHPRKGVAILNAEEAYSGSQKLM